MLGLRSLFTILKGRKLVFTDPTKDTRVYQLNGTTPLPLEPTQIRAVLNHDDPAITLAVAIIASHALTNLQVRNLHLTAISDGRLTMPDGRVILVAGPVRDRLARWLDFRATKWPNTRNPHLFATMQTAPRLNSPGHQCPWKKAGISAQALREDRILAEVRAIGGDSRRLTHLFGLSIEGTNRYVDTLNPPTW